ncbi:MAG: endonuclease VII domain-containing protein [Pseudomonadota bacterium]
MPRKKIEGICKAEGCTKPLKTLGLCANHYQIFWKYGRIHKVNIGDKRCHPFYHLWHERKQTNSLVKEWHEDFWKFVAEIGDRPSPKHILVRFSEKPYGPDNFAWRETLKREPGESKKSWYARKWASQQVLHPARERRRDLYRRFGISIEQYDAMYAEQGGVCAICKKPETAIDHKLGSPKRLAVDHCHTSSKVRGLLCWACNSALGKIEDSIPTLEAMILYLRKHQ